MSTLWTNVWKFYIEQEDWVWNEYLLNDTIWFIRDLPPELIKAFSSTLEDSIESDILLHVIDAADRKVWDKIKIIDDTLSRIWANQKKIYVFNKIDLIDDTTLNLLKVEYAYLNPVFISANDKIWFDQLKNLILNSFNE